MPLWNNEETETSDTQVNSSCMSWEHTELHLCEDCQQQPGKKSQSNLRAPNHSSVWNHNLQTAA